MSALRLNTPTDGNVARGARPRESLRWRVGLQYSREKRQAILEQVWSRRIEELRASLDLCDDRRSTDRRLPGATGGTWYAGAGAKLDSAAL